MPTPAGFRISSYCHEGGCVAVGPDGNGGVRLTSSTWEDAPVVAFSGEEWTAFLLGVRAGEFDLDQLA